MTNYIFGSIHLGSLFGTWDIVEVPEGYCVTNGKNKIEIKKFRAIEVLSYIQEKKYHLILRERTTPKEDIIIWNQVSSQEFSRIENTLRENSFDYLSITIDMVTKSVKLNCGMYQNTPLYYTTVDNVLFFSSNIREILAVIKKPISPFLPHLAMLFFQNWRYSECTAIPGVFLVTERSSVIIRNQGIVKKFPEPFTKRIIKDTINNESEALAIFESILMKFFRDRYGRMGNLKYGTELSGGFDSSVIALHFQKSLSHGLQGFSMILPDEQSILQKKRINDFSKKFQIGVNFTNTATAYPLKSDGLIAKEKYYYHMDELYVEALEQNLKEAQRQSIDIMFTGIGGDELFEFPRYHAAVYGSEFIQEQEAISPNVGEMFTRGFYEMVFDNYPAKTYEPMLPESLLNANIIRSKSFLNHGVYPVSGFANVELFDFMLRLPESLLLKRTGLFGKIHKKNDSPKNIYQVEKGDSFTPLLHLGIKQNSYPLISRVFENAIVCELGLVDKKHFQDFYEAYVRSNGKVPGSFQCLQIIELEFMLQSLNNRENLDRILSEY